MPDPIRQLTVQQLGQLLAAVRAAPQQGRRGIDAVHLHHTWRPRRGDFRGLATVEAMRRYHMEVCGWSDIAQHLTIDPNGGLWTGRNWNRAPASQAGRNGSPTKGPFMIEMVGDFDAGQDPFDGPQRPAAIEVVALLLHTFGLGVDALCFHRELGSPKSCPGTAIDKDDFVAEVERVRARLDGAPRARAGRGRAAKAVAAPLAPPPFAVELLLGHAVTRAGSFRDGVTDPPEAEAPKTEDAAAAIERFAADAIGVRQRGVRAADFPPSAATTRDGDEWNDLRLHVVNLSRGELSSSGAFRSTPLQLDAIVDAIAAHAAAAASPHVVLHAHGGLVNERKALEYARAMRPWWQHHGVYPVFFVWESGLLDTLRQYLVGPRAVRDVFDWTSDLAIELAIKAPGSAVWSGMKESARRASLPDASQGNPGGAWLFARRLAALVRDLGAGAPALHLVGHSAGAIFHSHLAPLLLSESVSIQSLTLLAPAARVELFESKLLGPVERGDIGRLSMFTMERRAERQDDVAFVYRKSLLYLVSRACEGLGREPLVGLQASLRKNAWLRALFGLDAQGEPGGGAAKAEIHYSRGPGNDPNPLTEALAHGDFDNDRATMTAVLRRILGRDDGDGYGYGAERFPFEPKDRGFPVLPPLRGPRPGTAPPPVGVDPAAGGAAAAPIGGPRRIALCVGIDAYEDNPLAGCRNDARAWGAALERLGFSVDYLFDQQATRQGLLDAISERVAAARSGDVLVFQYSGHGTQLPDLDGDESDGFDEAFVPIDYRSGAFLLDDDLATVLARLPQGVALTLFMDCCHSGTNSRFAPRMSARTSGEERVRYLPPSTALVEAHRAFRGAGRGAGRAARPTESSLPGVIHFAACRDDEYAWESGGQGDFTASATPLLLAAAARGDTNEAFLAEVRAKVVARGRQHPLLMSPAPGMSGRRLFEPVAHAGEAPPTAAALPGGYATDTELLRQLEQLMRLLRARLGA